MNTNLHPFTARYNGLKYFLKEYSKKELTKRLVLPAWQSINHINIWAASVLRMSLIKASYIK